MTEEDKDLKDMFDESEETPGLKVWIEDNLRILLSILVVIAIAGGIYSYSKRAQAPMVTEQAASEERSEKNTSTETPTSATSEDTTAQAKAEQGTEATPKKTEATPENSSSETDTALVIKAIKGQGETHLARQALADYLAKNPDSQLTKEHKIYIEDYLRKHNAFSGAVRIGTSVEFEKDLIQKALVQSKTLNEKQLNNLKRYSARVASLS